MLRDHQFTTNLELLLRLLQLSRQRRHLGRLPRQLHKLQHRKARDPMPPDLPQPAALMRPPGCAHVAPRGMHTDSASPAGAAPAQPGTAPPPAPWPAHHGTAPAAGRPRRAPPSDRRSVPATRGQAAAAAATSGHGIVSWRCRGPPAHPPRLGASQVPTPPASMPSHST